jgi:hypothetical protein
MKIGQNDLRLAYPCSSTESREVPKQGVVVISRSGTRLHFRPTKPKRHAMMFTIRLRRYPLVDTLIWLIGGLLLLALWPTHRQVEKALALF